MSRRWDNLGWTHRETNSRKLWKVKWFCHADRFAVNEFRRNLRAGDNSLTQDLQQYLPDRNPAMQSSSNLK
jgi:hypothetical protein